MMRYLYFLMLVSSLLACQEARTQGPAYDVMLRSLLKRDVPMATVPEIAGQPGLVWLDARSLPEYEVSHLPGARHIGYESFDSAGVAALPRETPIIVYCSVGYRSENITRRMQAMGFTQVRNLYGGLFEWVNQGHPVVDRQGNPTDAVHGYNSTWGIWVKKGKKVYTPEPVE
ncbi:MAG: rhodanese-like domain-containing protein [Bacteroidia bacterium]|nr:rhodanese-like domain-containing protein [Bacteroidia bacterium]